MNPSYNIVLSRSKRVLRKIGFASLACVIVYLATPQTWKLFASVFGLVGLLGIIIVLFLAGAISIMDAVEATSRWRSKGVLIVAGLWAFYLTFAVGVMFFGVCIARTLFRGFFR